MHDVFEAVARQFGVLGEPARLRILHVLGDRERCVNEILHQTGLAQSNASRHLGLLYKGGVVSRRREGTQVFYRVAHPAYVKLCRAMAVQGADAAFGAVRSELHHVTVELSRRPGEKAAASPTPPANEKEEASV
ncbi:MAG TPA: metalloregulator ArsR/SmtB family transcription factor [Hydrogenophaga sp.]|uniref:ArsR/SmtB family transcription factor n=1 Tax=Hydrogenophaga sp. TaxID=1904254 RepID=UPI002C694564|nr:metalloregulator ArsR/SmtB family transcription factor [Hydrogenophaga sp.]HMN91752.1 metalloregulator ArsR/SmtB family transcription factor [Hydrogenophaga sp.]HMP10072.1 metalloregulator ArsR/SmtB family transcription factor [Hydrogenophaga sp.]